ncbi:MAG TPA: hypothetical protein ENO27_02555 [Caldithrix sp.]|nr:hypothetical protein [Bacteroidales bacterium]MBN2764664.1 hypothetical protein [Bacteroidales bacterium]HEM49071.1 hypothetical protein [Caldithrix sp.]
MKLIITLVLLMAIRGFGSGYAQDSVSFLIAKGNVEGLLTMGDDIDSVITSLSKTYKVIKAGVPEGTGRNALYPVYHVYDAKGLLCTLERGWSAGNRSKIVRFTTPRPEFMTRKGIKPGMTYGELKNTYKLNNINYSGGQIIYVLVSGFEGVFSIEVPDNVTLETRDYAMKIPYEAVIKEIIVILYE